MNKENHPLSAPKEFAAPQFWRDADLPFVEARSIRDGRKVCYAMHSHEAFSIGVITGGRTVYVNKTARERVGPQTVVMMNPGDVHACNPIDGEPWSYRMLYVDTSWLGGLQHEWGFSRNVDFRSFATTMSTAPELYLGLNRFYDILTDRHTEPLQKQSAAIAFFTGMQQMLDPAPLADQEENRKLERAAEFISDNCSRSLKLEEICSAADISMSYLIRAFKKRYGMTPHAYLLNRRIQLARNLLKRGSAIADVALDVGFSDQAHFQRVFKQYLAATPGQYRGS